MTDNTRRAFLSGALAVPALAAPLALAAAVPADPVFAALARHRAAYEAFEAFCAANPVTAEPGPQPYDAPEWDRLDAAERETLATLANTVPTTPAGACALATYLAERAWPSDISATVLACALSSIARGLSPSA